MRKSLLLVASAAIVSSLVGCKADEPKKTTWSCANVAIKNGEALRCTTSALSTDNPISDVGHTAGGSSNVGGGAGSGTNGGNVGDTGNAGSGATGGGAGSGNTSTGRCDEIDCPGADVGDTGSVSNTGGGSSGWITYNCLAGAAGCPPKDATPGQNTSDTGAAGASGGGGAGSGATTDGGGSTGGSSSGGPIGDTGSRGSTSSSGGVADSYTCVGRDGQATCTKDQPTSCVPGTTPTNNGCTGTPSGSATGSSGSGSCGKFLLIDEDSIDNGNPPNHFSDRDVNDHIAEIGLRTPLPYFAVNVGKVITLHTGQVGDEGWFVPKIIPASWSAAGPTSDGITNFVGNPKAPFPHGVGPGLGTAYNGDREAHLDKIPKVTPLRATGLKMLVGQKVCAVVYDSDISIDYAPLLGNLKGANLGTVAFEVLSVTKLEGYSSSTLPKVELRILDVGEVCACAHGILDAPEHESSSIPMDISP